MFAIRHPIATLVAVFLTFISYTGELHILYIYMFWSFLFSLFVTKPGQVFLIGFGLGFIVEYFLKKR
jgi:hypothetical protein